jgi:hypothetical protein
MIIASMHAKYMVRLATLVLVAGDRLRGYQINYRFLDPVQMEKAKEILAEVFWIS